MSRDVTSGGRDSPPMAKPRPALTSTPPNLGLLPLTRISPCEQRMLWKSIGAETFQIIYATIIRHLNIATFLTSPSRTATGQDLSIGPSLPHIPNY